MDELFETLIYKALKNEATDIHMKLKKDLSIYYRIYGQLRHYQTYDKQLGERIMNYIKYKSFINVNYRLMPQTGSFNYYISDHIYFLRVSYLPGIDFESIVIRILNNHEKITINELSEVGDYSRFLNEICHKQSGLFLVSGATGSGKSTTLYALLDRIIEMGGKNVITLEDPIEMIKDHCLQIQINESLGITYFDTLRQILRHDPDVIMIGEIRDEKTAALAVTCALTGHLVLSTIHASSALLVIKRLLNMKVSLSDLQDILIGIASQKIKYDEKQHKVILLPEILTKKEIDVFLHDHEVKYHTFKENALMLVNKKHYDRYLFEEELNG
ncbi:competence protein ComGA [Kandleria vitulina]|jgi:competence protein ComGA|uniref:ATPase, T2SS/T4P/T4SS family n=1 Tax=Kandleria vitulina TaxID=1630 RepID=UPI0008C49943|nr:ATPase, T2SS/T4P/T4SS family [Kandleria vitulina]SEI76111.1 competence protein ComGA [Kandleria vitulina]